ncbi:LPXTG cell wall anchor domain-containing protein [Clavibacter sp. Sh2088]|uniref:LPXTG cell wall anchor domain-containing protein n=1 Tax=Clavibacter sp. Sh2088 TaxID=3397676 RepID=UPI0039E132BF
MSRASRGSASRSSLGILGTAGACALAAVLACGGLVATSAQAAAAVTTRASGVEIVDIDGDTLTAPTPLAEWASGAAVARTAASTGDVLKENATRTTGLSSTAGPTGATSAIASGELTLRARPAIVFRGLTVACTPGAAPRVHLDALTIGGADVTADAEATPGWSRDLPDSIYGATRVIVGSTETAEDGSATTVGIRVEAEAGASEIWRVRAGSVTCPGATASTPTPAPSASPTPEPQPTPAPDPSPAPDPGPAPDPAPAAGRVATGVTVTAPDGSRTIDGLPRVDGLDRTATADALAATDGSPDHAASVRVSTGADGTTTVGVGSFEQLPGAPADPLAEYRWTAFRVYGLTATITPSGAVATEFADPGSAVFVDGRWIDTTTDLYTGVDDQGAPRLTVAFGEREVAADGTLTVTAVHYRDLTGAHPDVRLGQVVVPPAAGQVVGAYGVGVTAPDGTVLVAPQPAATVAAPHAAAGAVTGTGTDPDTASSVAVDLGTGDAAGTATVDVSAFRQVPGASTDPLAEYRWPALRVAGLHAAVSAAGAMTVSFADPGSAVFVDGVWIDTTTDLYTGVDATGTPRVEVRFGERSVAADGTVTLTALHYRDLTGRHPEVRLGVVTLAPGGSTTPAPDPSPSPSPVPIVPDAAPTGWSAYGIRATGPSAVAATPVARPDADASTSTTRIAPDALAASDASTDAGATAGDGAAGQIRASGIRLASSSGAGSAALDDVSLYPGSRLAVRITGLRVAIDGSAAHVSSDGGTIAGQRLAAGDIAPGTRFALPDGGSAVLAEDVTASGARTVTGLHLVDATGLAADVSAAVVTTAAVAVDPAGSGSGSPSGTGPGTATDPGTATGGTASGRTPSGGATTASAGALAPGALASDGSSPAGTSGGSARGSLPRTGSSPASTLALAALLLLVGSAAALESRRRRRARPGGAARA